jgi:outer membrane cobalamin receptor
MLREVVVSASRTEQPLIEIPRSVTVIGEAVIKNSVYQSLGDLLNAQAGLYVVGANQTPGMNQNVFMRGSNSNQVAVLIDGVRITDPSSPNAAIDLSEISLANVERIEVIRGSHGTMFGGGAIGGVNHHSLAGDFLTVEFNPSVTLGTVLLYGSISTGYNAPSLYQLFDPSRGSNAHTSRGNPNLEPERSISLEVGMKKEFYEDSYITVSAYHTKVTESIEYVYLWNGATPLEDIGFADERGDTYINLGKQVVSGVEMEGYARLSDRISLHGNISFLTPQVKVDPQDIDQAYTGGHHIQLYNLGAFLNQDVKQKEIVRRPDLTAFTRFNYRPVEKLAFNVGYRYTGKRFDAGYDESLGPYGALARIEVEAYHLVDLGVTWQAMEKLSIAAKADNVLNEEYREVVGFQTRGRSLYLKLSARF